METSLCRIFLFWQLLLEDAIINHYLFDNFINERVCCMLGVPPVYSYTYPDGGKFQIGNTQLGEFIDTTALPFVIMFFMFFIITAILLCQNEYYYTKGYLQKTIDTKWSAIILAIITITIPVGYGYALNIVNKEDTIETVFSLDRIPTEQSNMIQGVYKQQVYNYLIDNGFTDEDLNRSCEQNQQPTFLCNQPSLGTINLQRNIDNTTYSMYFNMDVLKHPHGTELLVTPIVEQ